MYVRTCICTYVNASSVGVGISCVSLTPAHRAEKVRSLQAELEEQQERLVNGEQLPTVICMYVHKCVVSTSLCISYVHT